MALVLMLAFRGAMLVGWGVDRIFHTGWLLGVCVVSVIDDEVASTIKSVLKR